MSAVAARLARADDCRFPTSAFTFRGARSSSARAACADIKASPNAPTLPHRHPPMTNLQPVQLNHEALSWAVSSGPVATIAPVSMPR